MVQRGLTDKSSSVSEAASVVVDLVRLEHRLREVSCVEDRLGSLTWHRQMCSHTVRNHLS